MLLFNASILMLLFDDYIGIFSIQCFYLMLLINASIFNSSILILLFLILLFQTLLQNVSSFIYDL